MQACTIVSTLLRQSTYEVLAIVNYVQNCPSLLKKKRGVRFSDYKNDISSL